ncbi:hypothetical protein BJF93_21550 [Xaviernesmea oryzae]|uniref:Uncharacterized protein n=1 Tax=Xaviernesmea oryzae TaxID=464029 RepID=A0A1Q9B3U2_9HYPH|nr:hypothetical protein BJF93_21550 [Xaviernesmea oryzae]
MRKFVGCQIDCMAGFGSKTFSWQRAIIQLPDIMMLSAAFTRVARLQRTEKSWMQMQKGRIAPAFSIDENVVYSVLRG